MSAYCGPAMFNRSKAARMAGYSKVGVGPVGSAVFGRPRVRAAIEERFDEWSMRDGEILARLTAMARGDFHPFLKADDPGGRTYVVDLSSDEAQEHLYLVKKLRQTERHTVTDDDEILRMRKVEVELHDAKDALKILAKARGLLVQKHELTGADGGPLSIQTAVRAMSDGELAALASLLGLPGAAEEEGKG